jgi:hypothetical protein
LDCLIADHPTTVSAYHCNTASPATAPPPPGAALEDPRFSAPGYPSQTYSEHCFSRSTGPKIADTMRFTILAFASFLLPLSSASLTRPTPTTASLSSEKLTPFEAAITEAPIPLSELYASLRSHDRRPQQSSNARGKAQIHAALELLKRGSSCPVSFHPCNSVGAVGLCCREGANCSLDDGGNLGCCPEGAVCTGVITGGPITSGTISVSDGDGVLLTGSGTGSGSAATTTFSDGSTETSDPGFIVDGTGTVSETPSRANRGVETWVLEGMIFLAGVVGMWA